MSQRALGLLFTPPVTTQFVSNVERGVTPLPPAHIPTLTKALNVSETEFMGLLEQEYAYKLSGRLGKGDGSPVSLITGSGTSLGTSIAVAESDYAFMRTLYEAYASADQSARQQFANAAEKLLRSSTSGTERFSEALVTQ